MEENSNQPKESTAPKFKQGEFVRHTRYGHGRIVGVTRDFYVLQCKGDLQRIPLSSQDLTSEEPTSSDPQIEAMKRAVREVLGDYGWIETDFELAKRWLGGTMRLIPGREGLQPKDIPLEVFFKKIIGIREKLRVLEQKINNHAKLDPADKVELEGFITRCYGSLTSFNILFAEKPSQFQGSSGTE